MKGFVFFCKRKLNKDSQNQIAQSKLKHSKKYMKLQNIHGAFKVLNRGTAD